MRSNNHDKILEALELLNEAAKQKSDELYEMIASRYDSLKELIGDAAADGIESVVPKTFRRNRWKLIAPIALGALVIGVLMSKSSVASTK